MRIIETDLMDAAWHFSVEARFMDEEDGARRPPTEFEPLLMVWQTDRCVMIGANQVPETELDLDFARANNIQVVRRSSGGGAIYTDPGTLLITVITAYDPSECSTVDAARSSLAAPLIAALSKMGVCAELSGRNDILVGGKKVTGMAQYARNGKLCSHCSLLFDADLDMLTRILKVDDEKIRSKAIRSIRSRVANVCDSLTAPLSTRDFRDRLRAYLFGDEPYQRYELTEEDAATAADIRSRRFGSRDWTYKRSPAFTFQNSTRFPAGKLELFFGVNGGVISSSAIRGDFMSVSDIGVLEKALIGAPFDAESVRSVLLTFDSLEQYLGGVTAEDFISTLGTGI